MNSESMEVQTPTPAATANSGFTAKRIFLTMNCLLLATGNIFAPLLVRLYFLHGGKRIWFPGCLQTAGWPIMLIPILVSSTRHHSTTTGAKLFHINRRVFTAAAANGVLVGFVNYLYSYGLAKLPVSTVSLLIATQMVFTAALSFVLVKQKFTAYTINAVVLLTAGAVVLGLHPSGERLEGESDMEFWSGFATAVSAAALSALSLLLIQLTYKKAKQEVTYNLVMEIQLVMCFFATAFGVIGMLINKDFQAIPREAREFEVGVRKYYLVVVGIAILRQCSFLGVFGVVLYSSSLFSSIIITLCLPITQILAVIFYHEMFQEEKKGISLFMSLWGFVSYFFGGFKDMKKNNGGDHDQILETPNFTSQMP